MVVPTSSFWWEVKSDRAALQIEQSSEGGVLPATVEKGDVDPANAAKPPENDELPYKNDETNEM